MEKRSTLDELFRSQRLGVLATEGSGTPYTSLVAFAATEDLRHMLFVTDRHTNKYRNINHNPSVAILIDSRSNRVSDFSDAVAVTAIGRAVECPEEEREKLAAVYTDKHPNLTDFITSSDSALIRIEVSHYLIASFKETIQVEPD
ncbi:MAG: pyridoxamine 5'-phosphate oxidase family protein [Dehalococcoidia bacterium]